MEGHLGTLMRSHKSLRIDQDVSDLASNLGVPIYPLGGHYLKKNENVYDLTPELYKHLQQDVL